MRELISSLGFRCAFAALMLCAALAPPFARAQQGGQEIESLDVRVEGGDRAKIRARVKFALSDSLAELLRNGRLLEFNFEVRVFVERPYWINLEYETIGWSAQLAYDNILDSYQVITFNGEEHAAGDIGQALETIGDVQGLEIIGEQLGDRLKLSATRIQARFEVDVEKLPPPVRIELLSRLDWNFSSGWKEWRSADLARPKP